MLLYLAISILVFAASRGPKLPRAVIAALWLPLLVCWAIFLLVAAVTLFADDVIDFDPARRAWRQLRRILGLGGAVGVAS